MIRVNSVAYKHVLSHEWERATTCANFAPGSSRGRTCAMPIFAARRS